MNLYFNGPVAGVELFVDEVSVSEEIIAIENLLSNANFERETTGWSPRGTTTVSATEDRHTGNAASKVENRTET